MRHPARTGAALFLLIAAGFFAPLLHGQNRAGETFFPGGLEYSPGFDPFRPRALAAGETAAGEQEAAPFSGAPLWARDLRRGEIIFFGSFPFTVFFTRTFMDLYRCASHDWDRRYAPWPFKAAGAAPMSPGELKAMFGIAISSSLAIAVADHLIVRHKRNRAALEENGEAYPE